MKFLDQAKIYTRSGHGGPGAISFRREAHVPLGGPDGGDGGRGGDIVAMAVNGLNTLIDYRYQQHFKAESGRPGAGRDRSGASGKDVIMRLPIGTQVLSDDQQTVLADLTYEGQIIILAKGGTGGKGTTEITTWRRRSRNVGLASAEIDCRCRSSWHAKRRKINLSKRGFGSTSQNCGLSFYHTSSQSWRCWH